MQKSQKRIIIMHKRDVKIIIKIALVTVYILFLLNPLCPQFDVFESKWVLMIPIESWCEILAFQIMGWLMGAVVNEFIYTKIKVNGIVLTVIFVFLLAMTFSLPLCYWTNAIWPIMTIEYAKYFDILLGIVVAVLIKQKFFIKRDLQEPELDS